MAITTILNTKEITLVGSPQFLKFEELGAPSPASSYALNLFIWRGLKTAKPLTPQYQLRVPAINTQNTDTTGEFEISSYLREFTPIDEVVIPSAFSDRQYNGINGAWYTWSVVTDSGGIGLESPNTFLALAGQGIFADGVNPGSLFSDWFGVPICAQPQTTYVDVNGSYCIPVWVGGDNPTITNTQIRVNGNNTTFINLIDGGGFVGSLDSQFQIMYVELNEELFGSTVWAEGKTVQFELGKIGEWGPVYSLSVGCYPNQTSQLRFVGFNGTQYSMPILGRQNRAMETIRQNFIGATTRVNQGNYDPTAHQKRSFRIRSQESFTAFSGWTTGQYDQMVQEIQQSYSVWFIQNGVIIPVLVQDFRRGFINRIYNDEVGYTFNLEVATPVINDIF